MKTLLVTGSTGFIGSHVCSTFAERGWRILACGGRSCEEKATDNTYRGRFEGSVWEDFLARTQPDACVHTAGFSLISQSFHYPVTDFQANVGLFQKVLSTLQKHSSACKVILCSSAAVYGEPLHLPISENDTTDPISPYGAHKKLAEELGRTYHKIYGIPFASARIFSAYGSGLRRQLLWDLAQKMIANPERIELYGTGDETRNFIHISDIVTAFELLLNKADFCAESYNIATESNTSVAEAASAMAEAMNWRGKIIFGGQSRAGDPRFWRADIQKLQKLGFASQIAFAHGTRTLVEAWKVQEKL